MTEQLISSQPFSQAFTLMMVGMVFVFSFLGVLILTIKYIITPLAHKFSVNQVQQSCKKSTQLQDGSYSPELIAAISVAVKRYRQSHQ